MSRLCLPPCNCWSKVGPRGGGGGVGAPLVWPHQGWPCSPPPCSGGLLAGPGLLPQWCSAQFWCVGGLLYLFLLRISALCFLFCVFCFVFHLYSNVCPAKHVSSNTSRTMSIVDAYVSKVCLFLLFWILIGDQICSLRTANKSPKLNLCSS